MGGTSEAELAAPNVNQHDGCNSCLDPPPLHYVETLGGSFRLCGRQLLQLNTSIHLTNLQRFPRSTICAHICTTQTQNVQTFSLFWKCIHVYEFMRIVSWIEHFNGFVVFLSWRGGEGFSLQGAGRILTGVVQECPLSSDLFFLRHTVSKDTI